jgi:prephenate dehydrogenase
MSIQSLSSIKKIVLIGVGLIGGSFALGLKKAGITAQIIGVDRDQQALIDAKKLGIIHTIAESLEQAVIDADFILLAIPVAQTEATLEAILPFLNKKTIISDAGSTKADVVDSVRKVFGSHSSQFIPAHPIAGREINGPQAALSDLYAGKKVVITKLEENSEQDVELVANLWRLCKAKIHYLSPLEHDQVFASVSHLPHLLAFALVEDIANKEKADTLFQYAASGFRDFTRIAGSSPEMWRDISIANREAMLLELDSYMTQLERIRSYLKNSDGTSLEAIYHRAQQARLNWITTIEAAETQKKDGGD